MQVTKIKLNPWNLVGIFFLGVFGLALLVMFASAESGDGWGGMALVFFGLPIIFLGLALYILFSSGSTEPDEIAVSGQVARAFSVARVIRVVAWVILVAIAGCLAFLVRYWV